MEMMQVMEALDFVDFLKKWDMASFSSFICMTMEEYCKAHDMDVVEMARNIANTVQDVNEELGKY